MSLVVFVIKGRKVPESLFKKGIKTGGIWYRVEMYMNKGPDSVCELC